MKTLLKILFAAILICMIVVTTRASLDQPIWEAMNAFAGNPWAVATLWDAYFGFTFFYLWVLYKERRLALRILWFILIMGLGNMAMAVYALIEISRLRPDQPVEAMLLRRPS